MDIFNNIIVIFLLLTLRSALIKADILRFDHAAAKNTPLSFASYYGDHMVLQRSPRRAVIWGYATKVGDTVNVTLSDKSTYSTTVVLNHVFNKAVWTVKLDPIASHDPYTITASSSEGVIILKDVLFGDVWICSGQSNMQFTLFQVKNAQEEMNDTVHYPNIRIMTVKDVTSETPLLDLESLLEPWSIPSPQTTGNAAFTYFSAVCWLYAKYLHKYINYPLGMIDTTWGGTPVEAWSSAEALAKCGIKEQPSRLVYPEIPGAIGGPSSHSVLWNAMVHPFLNMTIYGAIWYQGEANAGAPDTYNCTFPELITDWRLKFHEGSHETDPMFPFGFVQLAGDRNNTTIVGGFPVIRWHQTADYGYVPNPKMERVFMSVAMDLPDFKSPWGSIHPRDKQDVAYRLVLSGLAVAYNSPAIDFQGPFPMKFVPDATKNLLTTRYNYTPIEVRHPNGFEICCTANCTETSTEWMVVVITTSDPSSITLSTASCAGKDVERVRYAWRETPCEFKMCAIYGKRSGLPAPPFDLPIGHMDIRNNLQKMRNIL